jgi:hypothetical protein
MLAYDCYHVEDEFGRLTVDLLDPHEWARFEVDVATYQREVDGQPFNRRP